MATPNVSKNPESVLPHGYAHNRGKPFNVANFADVTPEDEYGRTTSLAPSAVGRDDEDVVFSVTPSDVYSKEDWEAMCAHRRGNGIGGIDG